MRPPRTAARSRLLAAAAALAAGLAAAMLLAGCGALRPPAPPVTGAPEIEVTGPPQPLPSVEVTGYRGARLSSIGDFRENSIKGPQRIDHPSWRLKVGGLVSKPYQLSYDELVATRPAYLKVVTLNCVEGWSVTILWEGVRVADLIETAGPSPQGTTVIFRAHDGYSTSVPLDYLKSRNILLAYRQNGLALSPATGWPVMLVAENKWGYKWIKWVESMELSSESGFRGYWEQRGYSNGGDLDKSFVGP